MAIYTRIAAAIAAGLVFAGSAALADDAKAKPEKPAAVAQSPSCLTQTGSRISAKGKCRATGRSYTSDDIRRTGATTVGEALPLLDPSITVHH
ncbi:MAG TPA: hypothetical protein VNX69_08155 [Steroidobacteraceae bacterium]|nr:hypothetical protein [Steroidobacteraceae bacterium]